VFDLASFVLLICLSLGDASKINNLEYKISIFEMVNLTTLLTITLIY